MDALPVRLHDDDVEAGARADLRDPRPHEAATHHTDAHARPLDVPYRVVLDPKRTVPRTIR